MALIKCPECGKEVSEQAQACPYCGRPIKTASCIIRFKWGNMKGGNIYKTTVVIDGERFGEMKCGHSMDCTVSEGMHEIKLLFMGRTALRETVSVNSSRPIEHFTYKQEVINFKRVSSDENIPVCPTCGSRNIKRLSMTGKVAGVGILGLASNSVGKTFVCKNCKYKW